MFGTHGPNQQIAWFTYDADNRVVIDNGSLIGGQIVVTDTPGRR
jgi:hypothetical protein